MLVEIFAGLGYSSARHHGLIRHSWSLFMIIDFRTPHDFRREKNMSDPMKTGNRKQQIGLVISGPADRMRRFRQITTMLLALLSFSHVTALIAASSYDEETITIEARAFETHRIHRQNFRWSGKRKSRIGDYAEVTHNVAKVTTRYFKRDFKRDFKFSLHVATFEGAAVKLNVKNHTVFAPLDNDVQGIVDFAIEDKWGISDVEMTYDAYESTYTATITTGDSADDTWQFMAERRWKAGDGLVASGTLTNGSRTLHIKSSSVPPTFAPIAEIYEDGEVLCKRTSGIDAYDFRTGLSPDVKLLLLTAMEILVINVHGEYG